MKASPWGHTIDLPHAKAVRAKWLQIHEYGLRGLRGTLITSELFVDPPPGYKRWLCAYSRGLRVREKEEAQ